VRATGAESRLDGVIEASWLAALLVVPVAVAPHHAFPFPHPKASLLIACALLGTVAWVAKLLAGGAPFRPLNCPRVVTGGVRRLLLGMGVTAISLVVSTLFSIAPHLAWWGQDPRAMGAVTQLAIVIQSPSPHSAIISQGQGMFTSRSNSLDSGQASHLHWADCTSRCAASQLAIVIPSPGPHGAVIFQGQAVRRSTANSLFSGQAGHQHRDVFL